MELQPLTLNTLVHKWQERAGLTVTSRQVKPKFMKQRARKRDAPQGAVPCVFEITLQGIETISLAQ